MIDHAALPTRITNRGDRRLSLTSAIGSLSVSCAWQEAACHRHQPWPTVQPAHPLSSSHRGSAGVSACCSHLSSAVDSAPRRLIASAFNCPFSLFSVSVSWRHSTGRSDPPQRDHSATTSEAESLSSPHAAQLRSAMSQHDTARQRRGRGAAAGGADHDAVAVRDDSQSATAAAAADAQPTATAHADTQRLIVDVDADDEESRAAAAASSPASAASASAAAASPSRPQRRAAAEASGRMRALALQQVGPKGAKSVCLVQLAVEARSFMAID